MGTLFALASALFITAKDTVSKHVASRTSPNVSTLASFFYALPFYFAVLLIMHYAGAAPFETSAGFWMYVVLRALSDTGAELCKMHALKHGDLSLVISFFSLYPIILLLTSPLITGDPLTGNIVIGTGITVLGTLLVVYRKRGGDSSSFKLAVGFALAAAFFFSLNTAFDRVAVQKGTPVFSAFAMTILSCLLIAPLTFIRDRNVLSQFRANNGWFMLRGLFEILFMVAKLYALTFLSAPQVVAIHRISLVTSVVTGKMIFKEGYFYTRLAGSVLILIGAWMALFSPF